VAVATMRGNVDGSLNASRGRGILRPGDCFRVGDISVFVILKAMQG
jgi:hypothetical protein